MPKSATQIIGSFIFRNEGDGCLTSKYHHKDSIDGPFTEACKLITPLNSNDVFVGFYRTVWLDEKNTHVSAVLLISRNSANTSLFKLTWLDAATSKTILFNGSGMLLGDLLVGCYWV